MSRGAESGEQGAGSGQQGVGSNTLFHLGAFYGNLCVCMQIVYLWAMHNLFIYAMYLHTCAQLSEERR